MTRLTRDKLEQIRERAEKATDEEWRVLLFKESLHITWKSRVHEQVEHNACFIDNARKDVRLLLSHIDALEAERRQGRIPEDVFIDLPGLMKLLANGGSLCIGRMVFAMSHDYEPTPVRPSHALRLILEGYVELWGEDNSGFQMYKRPSLPEKGES